MWRLRWAWRDPRVRCFPEAMRARWSPTADVARPPRVVLSRWRLRDSLSEVWILWFHHVRWCVVLQRHYGGGSRIAVVFLVRCSLLLLDPFRRRVAFAGFDDYKGGLLVVAASDGVFVEVRVDVPIRQGSVVLQRCVVHRAAMFQSDRPELSCWRALMSRSNPSF